MSTPCTQGPTSSEDINYMQGITRVCPWKLLCFVHFDLYLLLDYGINYSYPSITFCVLLSWTHQILPILHPIPLPTQS